MNAEQLFSLCNMLAMGGWLILIFAGKTRWAPRLVSGGLLPLLLAIIYSALLVAHWGENNGGGFGTLSAVAKLFENHWLLLAGWVHYLAFDLFIGAWEVRDSQALGISHWIVVPCLALTFFFGPMGLLLYFAIRISRKRGAGFTTFSQ